MVRTFLITLVLLPLYLCQSQILEWECQCYKTQKDCTEKINGIPFTNITVLVYDKSCKQANLTCYGRHFRSWKQGIIGYKGRILFITAEYCVDDYPYGEYNTNECGQQNIDAKDNMIGCYAVNKPKTNLPLVS